MHDQEQSIVKGYDKAKSFFDSISCEVSSPVLVRKGPEAGCRARPRSRHTTELSPTDSTWRLSVPLVREFAGGLGTEDAEEDAEEGWLEEGESGEEGAVDNKHIRGIAQGRTALQHLPYLSLKSECSILVLPHGVVRLKGPQ